MFSKNFKINNNFVGQKFPTYFIADIAANHDGSLQKAIDLINIAAENGAQAAKFQHFAAKTIVSDVGFKKLINLKTHQSKWKESVYKVYEKASIDLKWTKILINECKKLKIDFFTSPYSLELVDYIDEYVPAYKVGSGDITWHDIVIHMAKKQKPMIIATGASDIFEIDKVLKITKKINTKIALLQCNTNYTASLENFKYINLNVLKTFKKKYKNLIYGLSDHTPGHSTVLGAIALGAKIIEKHLTDKNNRSGPDHKFSMNPKSWKEMISRSRELELSLGSIEKKVENNEKNSVIVQRRSIRASRDIKKNDKIDIKDLDFLRPCPPNSLKPYEYKKILGKKTKKNIKKGDMISLDIF
tara:strand:- start:1467 stop:2537 length:1071 start_codon:yes stop_codon:yes gene_type:complete